MKNRKILTATYASVAEAVRNGVFECFTTEDGYFGVNSDDGLNLGEGSFSDVVNRINTELVETSINDDGYRSCGWQKKLTYRIAGTVDGKLVYFDLRTAYEIHEGRMKEAEKQKDA